MDVSSIPAILTGTRSLLLAQEAYSGGSDSGVWLVAALVAVIAALGLGRAIYRVIKDRSSARASGEQEGPGYLSNWLGSPADRPTAPSMSIGDRVAPESVAGPAPSSHTVPDRTAPAAERDVGPGQRPAQAADLSEKPQPSSSQTLSPGIGRIFISYRRDDSADVAGRIYDRLVDRFGRKQVFKDVDSIPLGVDFRKQLHQMVASCDVLLAVMGDRWLAISSGGTRRLDDPKDFVRIELEAALQREIPVVPVLVRGVEVPAEAELPPSLSALAYRHGIAVRPDPDFHRDMDRLIEGLQGHFGLNT